MPTPPVQLGDRGLGRGGGTVDAGEAAQRVVAHDGQFYVRLGQLLAHHRTPRRAVLPGQRHQLVELTPEAELEAEQRHAALEGQGGQRDAPALTDPAHHVVDTGASPVEEHLVELAGARELGDGPHLDARLVHGHQQIREPFVARRGRVGPAHDEAPVRLVGEGCPDLLPRHDPLVAVADGSRLDVGQVASRVGLGVALAPQLGALPNGRQEAGLLRGRAVVDQGRAEEPFTHDVDAAGRGGAGVLLVEDDLLGHAGPPAAVLDRPAEAGPAAPRQHLLPAPAHLEAEGLVARAAPAPQLGELPDQMLGQEAPDLLAERHVLGAVAQIHRRGA